MKTLSALFLLLLTSLFSFAVPAGAQFGMDNDKASAEACYRVVDGEVQVVITFSIEPGWHLYHTEFGGDPDKENYAKKTSVTSSLEGVEWAPFVMSEPERYDDKLTGNWIWVHHEEALGFFKGKLTSDGAEIEDVDIVIDALTCTSGGDGTCIPYGETIVAELCDDDDVFEDWPEDWSGTASAAGGEGGSAASNAAALATRIDVNDERWESVSFPEFSPQSDVKEHGLFMWLLLAFLAGLILNVMPCVLPVVSIKVLSFVHQAGESKKRVFSLGLAFAAGIMVVFVVLAGFAAWAGKSWGEQFQSETFLVVMIGIIFAFSLSMFNVYELGVPSQVGALASGPPKEGLGDAFFKGIMATVLATPCSGPFLGSTLAWALAQPQLTVFLIFVTIGLGMALPYVVLTANPSFLKIVPKPGAWMETFKQVMGFVLLATAIYLMTSVRQDLLIYTITFLVFVAIGCWIWGRWATFDQSRVSRIGTLASVVVVIGLGVKFSFETMRNFYEGGDSHLAWIDFDPELLASYQAEERNVFIDFTADWCPNCKYNEKVVFESDAVRKAIEEKGVICMKADLTDDTPYTRMMERLSKQLGASSIPFLAVFPGDDPDKPFIRFDVVTQESMLELFDQLPVPEEGAVQ